MAEKRDPKELVTLEDLAISNMWETSALGGVGTEGRAHSLWHTGGLFASRIYVESPEFYFRIEARSLGLNGGLALGAPKGLSIGLCLRLV